MDDGIIELDTARAAALGFTADFYEGYLWKSDSRITISIIFCRHPGRGDFSRLLDRIWQLGYTVGVPTPLGHMQAILAHKGFAQGWELFEEAQEDVEVWTRGPTIKEGKR